jgi:hypothetical protein
MLPSPLGMYKSDSQQALFYGIIRCILEKSTL